MSGISTSQRNRLLAAGIHLILSLAIAALAAALVFVVWYPYPYREISGGRELFFFVVTVDVIIGPLLTLAVFNRKKTTLALRLDLIVIALLQLTALAYGLWTVFLARPVHLVFEIDRFRAVHAVDIPPQELALAPAPLRQLPWNGPTVLSVRTFKDENEKFDATWAAVSGLMLGARPSLWQSYQQAKPQVLTAARPLGDLKARFPARSGLIDAALKSATGSAPPGRPIAYVPMASRDKFWTVLLDAKTAEVIAFVPIDSF